MSNKGANKANTQNSKPAPKQTGASAGPDLESRVRAVREITHWPDADIKRVLEKYHYDTEIATNSILEGREGQYEWTEVSKKGEKKVEPKTSPKQPNGDFKRGDGRGKPFKGDRPDRTDRSERKPGPIGDTSAPRRSEGRGRARQPPFVGSSGSGSDSQYQRTRVPGGLNANGSDATRAVDPQQYSAATAVAPAVAPVPVAAQTRPQTQVAPVQSSVVSSQPGTWANLVSQQAQPQVQANSNTATQAQPTATSSLPASSVKSDVPTTTTTPITPAAVVSGTNQPDTNTANSFPTQSRAAFQQESASPTPPKAWRPKDAAPATSATPITSTVAPAASSGASTASAILPQQSSAPSSQSLHSAPLSRPGLSFGQRGAQPVSLPQSVLGSDAPSLSFQFGSLSMDRSEPNRFPVKMPQSTPQHIQSPSPTQSQLQSHTPLPQLQQYHVYQSAPLHHQQVDHHDQPLTQQYGGYPQYVQYHSVPEDHRLPNSQSAYYDGYSQQGYPQQLPATSTPASAGVTGAGTTNAGVATDSPKFGGNRGAGTSYRGATDQANTAKPDTSAPHDASVPLSYNLPAGGYPNPAMYYNHYGAGYGYQQQSYAPPYGAAAYGIPNQYGKQTAYSQPSQPTGPPSTVAAAYPPTTGQRPPAASASAYGESDHLDYKQQQQQFFPTYYQPDPQAVKGSTPQQSAAQGLGTSPPSASNKAGFSDTKSGSYREPVGTSYYNPQTQSYNGTQYQQSGYQHPSQQHVYQQPSGQGNTRSYHGA